jgi:hypothetical protein
MFSIFFWPSITVSAFGIYILFVVTQIKDDFQENKGRKPAEIDLDSGKLAIAVAASLVVGVGLFFSNDAVVRVQEIYEFFILREWEPSTFLYMVFVIWCFTGVALTQIVIFLRIIINYFHGIPIGPFTLLGLTLMVGSFGIGIHFLDLYSDEVIKIFAQNGIDIPKLLETIIPKS